MAALATVADVEARWRSLSASEETVATALLDDASAIVRSRVSDVDDRIADSDVYEALVVGIVAGMVLRVIRNPEGKRSETIDDYSYTRDDATKSGLLYLSDEEAALLGGGTTTTAAFTITPYGEPGYSSTESWA